MSNITFKVGRSLVLPFSTATGLGFEIFVPTRERWEADTGRSTYGVVETPYASIQIRP